MRFAHLHVGQAQDLCTHMCVLHTSRGCWGVSTGGVVSNLHGLGSNLHHNHNLGMFVSYCNAVHAVHDDGSHEAVQVSTHHVEHLVEFAHLEQHDRVVVLCLERPPAHGRAGSCIKAKLLPSSGQAWVDHAHAGHQVPSMWSWRVVERLTHRCMRRHGDADGPSLTLTQTATFRHSTNECSTITAHVDGSRCTSTILASLSRALGSNTAVHACQHASCGACSLTLRQQLSNRLSSIQRHCRLPYAAVSLNMHPKRKQGISCPLPMQVCRISLDVWRSRTCMIC